MTTSYENNPAANPEMEQLLKQSRQIINKLPAMGPVLMLYMQSSHRRFNFISDLEWLLMPPLMLKQCKLYMEQEFPIGYISWAFLSEEIEQRLVQSGGRLTTGDWKSGDRIWLIDMVAPFGSIDMMLTDVQANLFPGKNIFILAPDPKTGGVARRKLSSFGAGSEEQKVH